jgi:hypothetical protein
MAIARGMTEMSSALSLILALSLSAAPAAPSTPAPARVPRAGILVTASIGLGFIAAGAGFDLYGRTVGQPDAPVAAGTAAPADAYFVGGVSLIAVGLCTLLIATLMTLWYTPKSVFGVKW